MKRDFKRAVAGLNAQQKPTEISMKLLWAKKAVEATGGKRDDVLTS